MAIRLEFYETRYYSIMKYFRYLYLELKVIYKLRVGVFHYYEDEGYILAGPYYMYDFLLVTSLLYKYPAVYIMKMMGCI